MCSQITILNKNFTYNNNKKFILKIVFFFIFFSIFYEESHQSFYIFRKKNEIFQKLFIFIFIYFFVSQYCWEKKEKTVKRNIIIKKLMKKNRKIFK